jgi:hypothetical protein
MSGTTAEIIFHTLLYFLFGRIRILFKKSGGIHYHSRSAEATLQSIMVDKSLLYRMQFAIHGKTLDGYDILARHFTHRELTRTDSFVINKNSTGSAEPLTTSEFCSGKAKMISQDP